MNRKLFLGVATFLTVIGLALASGGNEVEAGFGKRCGGGAGGGLFAKLKAKCGGAADNCCGPIAPAPVCEPTPPACCEPAPKCHGGLFTRLRAKCADRKADRKAKKCCGPVEEPCCAPAAPAPCCSSAPAPVSYAPAAPCCGAASVPMNAMPTEGVLMEPTPAPMDGAAYSGSHAPTMVNDRGEEIVAGSVQIVDDGSGAAHAAEAVADGI